MNRFIKTLWALFFILLFGFFIFDSRVPRSAPTLPAEPLDAIIVFTGGKNRVHTGITLFQQKAAPQLFISGVNKKSSKNVLRLKNKPFPADLRDQVTLDPEASNTYENAEETALWAQENHIHRALLITADYHMQRSLLELRARAPQVEWIPYTIPDAFIMGPTGPWAFDRRTDYLFQMTREYAKYLRAMGRSFMMRVINDLSKIFTV